MSLVIRLKRIGMKNRPQYKIVAAEKRSKLSSVIKEIGIYNPLVKPPIIRVNQKVLDECLKNGAKLSPAVKKILHDQ